jgi:hypothetical protein
MKISAADLDHLAGATIGALCRLRCDDGGRAAPRVPDDGELSAALLGLLSTVTRDSVTVAA